MFTFKSILFLCFTFTVAFCFFITNTWVHGGLLYIGGTVVSTIAITMLFFFKECEDAS
jgi:hypothetical protein